MTYDDLLNEADRRKLTVKEKPLLSAKGRIYGKRIAIKTGLTDAEKTCTLAEEIGHYETTVGNILDQTKAENRKQEKTARKWAVDSLLSPEDLIKAVQDGCQSAFEVAEYLNITEDFLQEAITVFRERYGHYYESHDKIIIFNDIGFTVI